MPNIADVSGDGGRGMKRAVIIGASVSVAVAAGAFMPVVMLHQAPHFPKDYSAEPEAYIYLRMVSSGTETNVVSGETFLETGSVTLETTDLPSGFSGSYRQSLDGDNNYLEHDGLYLHSHSLTQLTIMGWIRNTDWTVNRRAHWIVQQDIAAAPDELALVHGMKDQAGNVMAPYTIIYHASTITADIDAVPTYSTNAWHHHAITYSNGTLKTYVNGVAVETNTSSGTTIGRDGGTPPWRLWFADPNQTGRDWRGDLDEVFVMTGRVLNVTDIQSCMTNGVDGRKGAAD